MIKKLNGEFDYEWKLAEILIGLEGSLISVNPTLSYSTRLAGGNLVIFLRTVHAVY